METLQNIAKIERLRNGIKGDLEDRNWMINEEKLVSESEWQEEIDKKRQTLDRIVKETEKEVLEIFATGDYYIDGDYGTVVSPNTSKIIPVSI